MEISWKTKLVYYTGLVLFAGTGITFVGGSIIYMTTKDKMAKLLMTPDIYLPTLVLGIIILLTSTLGAIGGWRPIQYKPFLKIQIYTVVLAVIFELVMGLDIWMMTITPRQSYSLEWSSWSHKDRAHVQLLGKCCGYLNVTDRSINSKHCDPDTELLGCSAFIINIAKTYYVDLYTCYFVFILLSFFTILTTAMLIEVRNELDRYEKGLQKAAAKE